MLKLIKVNFTIKKSLKPVKHLLYPLEAALITPGGYAYPRFRNTAKKSKYFGFHINVKHGFSLRLLDQRK
jgi:hypothetical protein